MRFDLAVNIIHRRLGMAEGLDEVIGDEMRLQQSIFESAAFLPWFLKDVFSGTLTIDVQIMAEPDGFIRESEGEGIWVQDLATGEWAEVMKDDYRTLLTFYGVEKGLPAKYARVGTKFYFFPTPDKAYPFNFIAYKKDVELNSADENKWMKYAPDLLISSTGVNVAQSTKNTDALTTFAAQRKASLEELVKADTAQEQANLHSSLSG